MDTVKFNSENVKLIAHRGLSGLEKENTNAAFVAAGNRNYFGIETDLHVTKDGVFVLYHDDITESLINIEKNNYRKIETLLLQDLDGNYRSDLTIPLLSEYIRICKRYEKTAVLELKNEIIKEEIQNIIKTIKEEQYLEKTIFISFHWKNLIEIRKLLPTQPLQYLRNDWEEDLLEQLVAYHIDLALFYKRVTSQLVETLHRHQRLINCWTCDNPSTAEKLVSYGVDFITTNTLEGK